MDKQKAFELYQKAAATWINNLGICYEYGIGTSINKLKALKSYQNAANLGLPSGLCNLAYFYKYGIGVGVNKRSILNYFEMLQN